jgi:hypothetical protein
MNCHSRKYKDYYFSHHAAFSRPLQKFQKYPWSGLRTQDQIVSVSGKYNPDKYTMNILCLSLMSRVSVDRYTTPT